MFWTKIRGGLGQGSIQKKWDPLLISATVEASNFKFSTQLAFGTSLPKKQRLGPKLAGVWDREHPKKFGTHLFLQPLKVTTSNLVHKLGLGLAYQKTTFKTKIGGGLGQGSIQKIGTPYLFLQLAEKLVHNRFTLRNTSFRTKLGRV